MCFSAGGEGGGVSLVGRARATPRKEVLGSFVAVAVRSQLVGSVSL